MIDNGPLERVFEYDLQSFEKVEHYQSSCTLRIQEHILQIHYHLIGKINQLELNQQRTPLSGQGDEQGERKIGLWERSCFEFFIKNKEKSEYYEFNFSPFGDWNCFYFASQNDELSEYNRIKRIPISINHETISKSHEEFHLTALINLNHLGRYFYQQNQMRVNLSCILLDPKKGSKEHWALAHPPKKPNFHDFNCFLGQF